MIGDDDRSARLAQIAAARRVTAGLNPDKRAATLAEITRARAAKEESAPGTQEHAMREARLADIEDRRPDHRIRL